MNTSVEIRSGRFTVIDDPEENAQVALLPNHDPHAVPKAGPLLDVVSSASSTSDLTSPASAYDAPTPHHPYASLTPSDAGGPHSIGPYSSHVNNEVYTLSDVAPPLYRGSSESGGGRQVMAPSPNDSDESSQSSQSTGYGDASSPSGTTSEAEVGSPLSGAAMRRSGRFTVIDDEDNGVSGTSERVEDDSRSHDAADRSLQYDRVQSIPDDQQRSGGGNEESSYMGHKQQSGNYSDLLHRQQMHSNDPELAGGQQQQHEHARPMGSADVEQVYEPHHTHGHGQHAHDHMQQQQQQQQPHQSPLYEQSSQLQEQYEQQQSSYDQQHYQQQQQQQYDQPQYEQGPQQAYEQAQYDEQQQYEQQSYEQQQQQQYDQQHYNPSSSPQHYEQSPQSQSQHVSYADEQQHSAYMTDDPTNASQQHYTGTSASYDEQTSSPSPMQADQYGDGQGGGLDLDALAAECGPINLFNMLFSQVAKVMEENEWLKQENVQLRDENYELQTRLSYAIQQQPPGADTPSVHSSSASPEYLSPHHSPSRLTRSVTTDPHSINTTSSSHYSDDALTKTAPIRSVTEHSNKRPSPVTVPHSTPSPSPSQERVEDDSKSQDGETSEQRNGVLADGGEMEQSHATNGVPSSYLSSGSSMTRPTSALARITSATLNGGSRTSSANSVASSASPSPMASTMSTSSSSSPINAASKQAKRKPSVSIKAGELSPSKGNGVNSLSSTLPSLLSVSLSAGSSSAASTSASALPSALRKPTGSPLLSANKIQSPASSSPVANGAKKTGVVTPRKKSVTGASGKTATASKSSKGNFFASAGGGSDPFDQILNQAVSGLSGLCSVPNGKINPPASSTADKSKPSASASVNSDATAKKDRNAASTSQRDAVNVLAASLHLKPKDRPQPVEGHSPGVSGASRVKEEEGKGKGSGGGGGGGGLDDLTAYTTLSPPPVPTFGVGSSKDKHDNLFL